MSLPPIYDPEAVRPMQEELHQVGMQTLRAPEDVDALIAKGGTALVMINSVCGCAAGNARPGVTLALQHNVIPDHLATVFAGMDRESVDHVRGLMSDIPPSSPFVALFKDGEPVHILPRHMIEQMDARQIASNLAEAFQAHCTRQGPSIPAEEFARLQGHRQCGSTVPLFGN